jgi:hypothetical protein
MGARSCSVKTHLMHFEVPACGTGLVVRAWTHLAIVHIEPSELEQIQMLAFTIHESSRSAADLDTCWLQGEGDPGRPRRGI